MTDGGSDHIVNSLGSFEALDDTRQQAQRCCIRYQKSCCCVCAQVLGYPPRAGGLARSQDHQLAGQGGACVADRLRVVSQVPPRRRGPLTGRLTLDSGSDPRASSGIRGTPVANSFT